MPQDAGPEPDHWFEPIADHLGAAYLRYSFTKGTAQEVDFLVDALGLEPGMRVLDVGCGPGRHAHELARRGIAVHGVDISRALRRPGPRHAPAGATFERLDARALAFDADFDAAVSLCQGGFGLVAGAGEDATVLEGMARAVARRPHGHERVQRLLPGPLPGPRHARRRRRRRPRAHRGPRRGGRADARSTCGRLLHADGSSACSSPPAGLRRRRLWSVEPGAYGDAPPDVDTPSTSCSPRRP